jgi:membrane protein YqaA with SNARE-associated domain
MTKLMIFVGATVGGAVGWWLGAFVGVFTAFVLSMVGTGAGMYACRRFAIDRLE